MDDNTNMTYNSSQVIDMAFTNISISGNSTNTHLRQHALTRVYLELVVFLMVLPILGVFGIVGNILAIVVLGRDEVMKKTTRFLLRNLAIADIGFLTMFVLHRVYDQSQLLLLNASTFCWFTSSVFHVASIYSVVIVTGDRYIAICRPLHSGRLSTTRNARWAVTVVWCISVIFNIPMGIDGMIIPCNNATTKCYSRSFIPLYSDNVYNLVYFFILDNIAKIIIPLTVLIIVNVKLIQTVRASREIHGDNRTTQRSCSLP